jgi:hypothetical protein
LTIDYYGVWIGFVFLVGHIEHWRPAISLEKGGVFLEILRFLRFLRVFWEKWGGSSRFFGGEISLR